MLTGASLARCACAGGGGNAGTLSRTGGGPISAWLPARAWRAPGDASTPVLGIGSGATCELSCARLSATRIVGSLRSRLSAGICGDDSAGSGDDRAGSGGGFDGERARVDAPAGSGGGFVVDPARGGSAPDAIDGFAGFAVEPDRIGGGFVVEVARGGSALDVIDAFAGPPSGGGFVVDPERIGGGFVVDPERIGGGFVVDPARGAKPCVFVGLGAAAKPAAVLVVDVSDGIAPERSCAALRSSGGIALEADDRGALGDGDRAAGVRVDVASGPPRTVGSTLRPPCPIGSSPTTWTFVDVPSPTGSV
ncbi:MAG: hypothetical protein ACKV2T_20135 [Kofleriaceae bacterium]